MSEIDLPQDVADALIAIGKRSLATDPVVVPTSGRVEVPLSDLDGREDFQLDIRRARIDLTKGTKQTRTRQTIILVRLDFGGAPHRNPDGEEVGCPHIHIYREGYGDKWAYPLPDSQFSDIGDFWKTLDEFLAYCNVVEPPTFQRGLF